MNNPTAACVASEVSAKACANRNNRCGKEVNGGVVPGLKKRTSRTLTGGARLRPAGETNLPIYKSNLIVGQT